MTDDPIVEEVHRTRAKLLEEHGGSLERYLESLENRPATERTDAPIRQPEELRRHLMKRAS